MDSAIQALRNQLNERIDRIAEHVSSVPARTRSNFNSFFSEQIRFWEHLDESQLIDVAPGVGKTHTTTELVNRLWENHGIPTIVFTLSYKMMDVVEGREGWNVWRGKNQICTRLNEFKLLTSKGYSAPECKDCDCGYSEQFDVPGPTIAVINMLGGNPVDLLNLQSYRMWNLTYDEHATEPPDISLFHQQVKDFRLLVVDEFDSSRMVETKEISVSNLNKLARWTKSENT